MSASVGNYEYIPTPIGSGAFGSVYKGWNKDSFELVAIKQSKSGKIANEEIKILRLCLKQVNIVKILGYEISPFFTWIIMEFCNMDLAHYLAETGVLSEETTRIFFRQVASAMAFLQWRHIMHRDLKPQNLLLSFKPYPFQNLHDLDPNLIIIKVADFGLARCLTRNNLTKSICGTPAYAAPEVKSGNYYDANADLWSIGVIIHECLTGKLPEIQQSNNNTYVLLCKPPYGISKYLGDLLLRLLQFDPATRISFQDFFTHLFFIPQI